MSRLDRYYIPPGVPARPPAPPLPKKGILMMPPPPPPQITSKNTRNYVAYPAQAAPGVYQAPAAPPPGTVAMLTHGPQSLSPPDKFRVDANRPFKRRPLPIRPSMKYNNYEELNGNESQNLATVMALPDSSPRSALQRILVLYENGEHREAAAFMRRLSFPTFRQILPQLPADIFIDSMPHSLPILEALYAKLYLAGDGKLLGKADSLRPEAVVWQLVKFFANQEEELTKAGQMRWEFCGPFISSCKRLLKVLLSAEPRLKRLVAERKRALMKAIEGLGQHGLVGTSDEQLVNLHTALKQEFDKAKHAYEEAIQKLEVLRLLGDTKNGKGTVNGKSAPIAQSHQRQLSLKANEIQERLIKNKSLLNVVEPTLENTSLEVLLGILQQRIELDKECLFQYTQIKKDTIGSLNVTAGKNGKKAGGNNVKNINQSVAPIFMRYQRGCQQVLDMMKELSSDDKSSIRLGSVLSCDDLDEVGEVDDDDLSNGYHSDSESCVMTSGNSPFISKEARYHFLSRSVRLGSKHNIRASILASSLCLDSASLKGGSISGQFSIAGSIKNIDISKKPKHNNNDSSNDNSNNVHSSSGVSSGSSDTASNEDKSETPLTQSTNGVVARSASRSNKRSKGNSNTLPLPMSNKNLYNDTSSVTNTEPIYQGIVERDISVFRKDAEVASLKDEVSSLKFELAKTQKTMFAVEDSEKELKAKLAEEKHKIVTLQRLCDKNQAYGPYDERPSGLVKRYGELYSQLRLETLDQLDKMPELVNSEELKNKLLFSVVVLAFRSVTSSIEAKRDQVRRILQLPPPPSPQQSNNSINSNDVAARTLEEAITSYLRRATEQFDLSKNVEEVLSQIWATLYDYPCLKSCDGIVKYVKECVRVAWGLVNQSPAYTIEYETRQFRPDLHVRNHNSQTSNILIQTYLWPALLEGEDGPCVQKGVIVT